MGLQVMPTWRRCIGALIHQLPQTRPTPNFPYSVISNSAGLPWISRIWVTFSINHPWASQWGDTRDSNRQLLLQVSYFCEMKILPHIAMLLPTFHTTPIPLIDIILRKSLCLFSGSRPMQAQGHFTHASLPRGTTSCYLCIRFPELQPSRNAWKHVSFIWPFLYKHQQVQWPVDVLDSS